MKKTDRVGRRIENEHFVADLSHRIVQDKQEDSGTLRALTYKPFGVTLLRTRNRMHWAPNLQRAGARGYGYGFVNLEYSAARTTGPQIRISDGADNGKYWSRVIIGGEETQIQAGDRFEERTAYVLFRCSQERPLGEFFDWQKKIRSRHGRANR